MRISLYSSKLCEKMAKKASLRYVKDTQPGITRKLEGKTFSYYLPRGKKISDLKLIKYINSLAIPPAYQNVWICPFKNGHILATGRDTKNRKQYCYHPLWREIRQQQKFTSMIDFGQALAAIRKHVEEELARPIKLSKKQVICAIIYLLDSYGIRIGNSVYAKENKSYGLTTLRKKHLSFKKDRAVLNFSGKNAKLWQVILKDKKIIKILKRCEEIPGYELFKYYDENSRLNIITSQEINAYLQELSNHPFTAKDFRTWTACREVFFRLLSIPYSKKNKNEEILKEIVNEVANILGHTPAICLKNYIYPEIITSWKEKKLTVWLKKKKKLISNANDDEVLLNWLTCCAKERK